MTPDAPTFSPALFDRFLAALELAAPGIGGWILPGVSDEEISIREADLPGVIPDEIRQWWKLQGGLRDPGMGESYGQVPDDVGGTDFELLSSFSRCVETYHSMQHLAEVQEVAPPEEFAPDNLFPLDSSAMVSFALAPEPSNEATIILTETRFTNFFGESVARSLGEFLSIWIQAFESGGLSWESPKGWRVNHAKVPEPLLRYALVGGPDLSGD